MTSKTIRLIVHIGTEKTGTSSLQNVLHQNMHVLEKIGIAYYASDNRVDARVLAAAAVGDTAVDDYLRDLGLDSVETRREFQEQAKAHFQNFFYNLSSKCHTVLISSEHFQSRLTQASQIRWLKDFLEQYSSYIEIIVYLRRQFDMAESLYSTALRNKSSASLEAFVSGMCRADHFYFNHERLLRNWSDIFGVDAVLARIFEKESLKGGDILDDFLDAANIAINLGALKREAKFYNSSISSEGQLLLRLINASSYINGELKLKVISQFLGVGQKIPLASAEEIQGRFNDQNELVRTGWFPHRKKLFMSPIIDGKSEYFKSLTSEKITLIHSVIDHCYGADHVGVPELVSLVSPLQNILESGRFDGLSLEFSSWNLLVRIDASNSYFAERAKYLKRPSVRLKRYSKRLLDRVLS